MPSTYDKFWLFLIPRAVRRLIDGRVSVVIMARNFGWLIVDRSVRLLLGLLVGAWIARYLGPGQYGQLAYVVALVSFVQPMANLGMDNIVIRDIANDKTNAPGVLGSVFLLRCLFGLLSWFALVLFVVLSYGVSSVNSILTVLVGISLLTQASDVIDLWFQSQSQSKRTVIAKLSAYLCAASVKIFLIVYQMPLIYFGAALMVEALVSLVALQLAYTRFKTSTSWSWHLATAKRLLLESWPLILSCIFIAVYLKIDQVVIKHYWGEESVGVYAAAVTLGMLATFVPVLLNSSIAPFLARKKMESDQEYKRMLSIIFKYYALSGWLISLLLALLLPFAIVVLFGHAYAEGATVASIYAFVNLFVWMDAAQALWILNERKSRISLLKAFSGAFACAVLSLCLVPLYGLMGGAIAALFSQLVNCLVINFFFAREIFSLQVRSIFMIGLLKKTNIAPIR